MGNMSLLNWFTPSVKKNIPKASYQRLLRRAGIHSISKSALQKIDTLVADTLEKIVADSILMSGIRNASTVSYKDVETALQIHQIIAPKKKLVGGDLNYQGFCDANPSQCVDNYVPPTCSGGGDLNYQGFCDSNPSQCVDNYVPPTCSGGSGELKYARNGCKNKKHR